MLLSIASDGGEADPGQKRGPRPNSGVRRFERRAVRKKAAAVESRVEVMPPVVG
jgi:hypothetical protein